MKLTINNQTENPLLNRTEIRGVIVFQGATPSNNDVIAAIADKMKTDGNLVVMKHVYTTFSQQEGVFHGFVYKDAAAIKKAEVVTKHLKKQAEEGKKAAEEKAKAAAETKAEEKAEEPKAAEPAKEESESPKEEVVEETKVEAEQVAPEA